MSDRERNIEAQNLLKSYTGKSHELYKLSIKDIRETLKEYNTPKEKLNFLKDVLKSIIEYKLEIKQEIDETYSAEEQINSIYPVQLGIQELEKEVDLLILDYKKINDLKPEEPNLKKLREENLSHKQQILLLFNLGFFDLPKIKELSIQKKGKIISAIINRDEKNASDYIRYFNGKNIESKYECKTPTNILAVNQILKEVGLPEIP